MNLDQAAIDQLWNELPDEYKMKTLTKERLSEIKANLKGRDFEVIGTQHIDPHCEEDVKELIAHAEATIELQERNDQLFKKTLELQAFNDKLAEHASAPAIQGRFTREESVAINFTQILLSRNAFHSPERCAEEGAKAAKILFRELYKKEATSEIDDEERRRIIAADVARREELKAREP